MQDFLTYGGLFLNALAAGSILPVQSEAALTALLVTGYGSPLMLLVAATLGNTGGAVVNWYLGRRIEHFRDRKWFPAKAETLARAETRYRRYGRWILLLSWIPLIGDALTVMAGILHEKLWLFILLVGTGKLFRYAVLVWAILKIG